LTAEDVRNFYASLCQELNRRTGIPQLHTARRAGAVLHKMHEDAVSLGVLSSNPAYHIPLAKPAETSSRQYSIEEITALVRGTRDDFRPFVLVSMLTGARFGEARELRWLDVDVERRLVHIRRQRPTREPAVVRAPKRGITREVEMMDLVRKVLTVNILHKPIFPTYLTRERRYMTPRLSRIIYRMADCHSTIGHFHWTVQLGGLA